MPAITKSPDARSGPNARRNHMTRAQIARDLEESRARQGLTRVEEWNGLKVGDPVRLKNAGTGRRVFKFKAHYTSRHRGTEWVDVVMPDDKHAVIYPVRPEQIVKVRSKA